METLWQDIRYGLRTLANSPGFTAVAVLTLALGIGVNTTIFTALKALVLRPLPGVRAAEELCVVYHTLRSGKEILLSYSEYRDLRDRNSVFSALVATRMTAFSVTIGEHPERLWGEFATGNLFQTFGVRPAAGRLLTSADDRTPGAHPVAVISYKLWQRRFGGDSSAIGQKILIGTHPFTIVGVTDRNYLGSMAGGTLDIFIPVMMASELWPSPHILEPQGAYWLFVQGRPKPGVKLDEAAAAMAVLGDQMLKEFPDVVFRRKAVIAPLWRSPLGPQRLASPLLTILMPLAGILLLTVCANLANLLLARAAGRSREIAVRLALGAGRWRLMRQLLTEACLLSLLGGLAALLLALWTTDRYFNIRLPTPFPVALNADFDAAVFGFTLVIAVVSAVLSGLAPALQASRVDLVSALRDDASGRTFRRSRLRSGLLVAQVALSLVLLISAGLVVQSFRNAQRIDPGFDPRNIALFSLDLDTTGYDQQKGLAFQRQLLERVESLPGVESATLARFLPLLVAGARSLTLQIEGYHPGPDEDLNFAYNVVSPGYLRMSRIPLMEGREFTARDVAVAPDVALVNQTLAKRYWPGQSAIGRKLWAMGRWREVVGVARDCKYVRLTEAPQPYFYLPLAQNYAGDITLHVRAPRENPELVRLVQQEFSALDPNVAVFDVFPMSAHLWMSTAGYEIASELLAAAGLLALLLAAVGIYGVAAYSVARRTREIGIRMALGARPRDVLRLVLGQGLGLALAGVGIGLALALAASQAVGSLLYGISATDPLTITAVTIFLVVVALLACYLPARRAMKIEPIAALRYE